MNEYALLAFAFVIGSVLGVFYYGGLWFTVRDLPNAPMPALWVTASFIVRTLLTLLGLYLVMNGEWQRLFASMVGFIAARIVLTHYLAPAQNAHPGVKRG